ncbi:hypothetical protein [Bacillus sp. AFS031507]|uniref:hypothetical protein n=1 Tax=Bacillus sp. AFS031507 TaxID=2033496 RepID=UPI0015D4CB9A|nr:hypothetical protein [Bacillus sp. AFS031507]
MELTIYPFLGLPDGVLLEELLDLHTRILAVLIELNCQLHNKKTGSPQPSHF